MIFLPNIIVKDVKFSIDPAAVAEKFGMETHGEEFERLCQLAKEVSAIAKPTAVFCEAPIEKKGKDYVEIAGERVKSKLMADNFAKLGEVYPYVATCGVEVEQYAKENQDPLEFFLIDEMMKMLLMSAIVALREQTGQLSGTKILSAMNPGSAAEWQITGQRQLFAMLGTVEQDIGVNLTESCLMVPTKSVSGIMFKNEHSFENCQLCTKKCPNRRAPYDAELAAKYEAEYQYGM